MVSDLATSDPMALLTPDEVIDTFPNRRIYIGGKQDGKLKNIIIFEMDGEGMPTRRVVAKEGSLSVEPQNAGFLLRLYHARFEDRDKADPGDMTKFRPGLVVAEGAYRLSSDKLFEETRHEKSRRGYALSEFGKYMADGAGGEPLKAEVEYQRRFSLALACVTFALIGVPLGITAHRKETSVGFGLGIAVALAYYSFILFAQVFAGNPEVHPIFVMWLPNILFGLLGAVLFIRLARQ
jgi:lipopolysaccharide export system permease protein